MHHITGGQGFIGKYLLQSLSSSQLPVNAVSRPIFELTDPKTYGVIGIQPGDTVTDCVAKIDASPEEQMRVNVKGLQSFLDYLNSRHCPYTYIYFSTYSTLLPDLRASNPYVNSKYEAEQLIRRHCPNYKIIRLVFPFGRGEGTNRLISRLIRNIRSGETVAIDNFSTNLTPIMSLMRDFALILSSERKEINYSTNHVSQLEDIVKYIFARLALKPNYRLSGKNVPILVDSDVKSSSTPEDVFEELNRMLHE